MTSQESIQPCHYAAEPGRTELQGATLVKKRDGRFLPSSTFGQEELRANAFDGVNFAVYAPEARRVELCLFDTADNETRLKMYGPERGIWHLYVPGLAAGQAYGFRTHGRWGANLSPRFNEHKLLLDPYSRQLQGKVQWHTSLFDYRHCPVTGALLVNDEDSAPFMPRSVVRGDDFDWQDVARPEVSAADSVIYELHVKGFTRLHPEVPEELRGTYLGLCHPAVIDYLKDLGVTAVELLPVTSMLSEQRLVEMGLKNYWGYNPLCLMAPEPSLAVSDPVTELKTMIREMHRAGIEVILDVVFNHTSEGGDGGPSLSLRGLAEQDYYLVDNNNGRLSMTNYTGCGNTMNFDSPQTLKLTMDALRYWVEEYQVDGFRFDLAPTMARQHRHFRHDSPFFQAIHQDPVLSRCKMVAEPWDIGPEGYRLGGFPMEWQEWNDRYRDSLRSFWRGDHGRLAEMGWRIAGSVDVFGNRRAQGSINYLCSHDGFTLNDLVSYEQRHNLANGENNRDGDQHNYSSNHGVEGETGNAFVLKRRNRTMRNMLASLMLSRGTPMLMAGDEFGNGQKGNNNAYCQDSPLSWLDWSWQDKDGEYKRLQDFTRQLIQLRQEHPLLGGSGGREQLKWFDPNGGRLTEQQLGQLGGGSLCIQISSATDSGLRLYIFINNENISRRFAFPDQDQQKFHFRLLDTSLEKPFLKSVQLTRGWSHVNGNSVVVVEEQA